MNQPNSLGQQIKEENKVLERSKYNLHRLDDGKSQPCTGTGQRQVRRTFYQGGTSCAPSPSPQGMLIR